MKRFLSLLWQECKNDSLLRRAAAASFYTVFLVPALIVCIVMIAGSFLNEQSVSEELFRRVETYAGENIAGFLERTVEQTEASVTGTIWKTVISLCVLILAGSGVFRELQSALQTILNIPPHHDTLRHSLRTYLLSLILLLIMGSLLVLFLIFRTVVIRFDAQISTIAGMPIHTLDFLNTVTTFTTAPLLFFLLSVVLPSERLAWKPLFIGAVVGGALFIVGTTILTTYIAISELDQVYGVASSLLVLLLWIYYSITTFLIGAEVADVLRRKENRQIA